MRGLVVLALVLAPLSVSAAQWSYHDPGDLIPGSGSGAEEWTVFAPGMRFPIEDGPAYPNSQVYMPGGSQGGGGSQCDAINYDYPWRDNYCETRSWDMPLCPSGTGHQGQDMRPASCDKSLHWMVAAEAGTITNIGSYSVYLTAADGTRFDYLHGDSLVVSSGEPLTKGERIGKVSNAFGGTSTTIHLHFNIKQDVGGVGFVYVSPYMSLVESYEELMGFGATGSAGAIEQTDCTSIRGWAQDPDAPDAAVEVTVWFDGGPGDPDAVVIALTADQYREDLCETLGSCEHGFELEVPRSLRDGAEHGVRVFAGNAEGASSTELDASPDVLSCDAPPVPDGVRRLLGSPEVIAAWGFSLVWDLANVDDSELDALPLGAAMESEPLLVRSESGTPGVWLVDGSVRRIVGGQTVADAWRLDLDEAEAWPDAEILALPEGTPVRDEPFLIKGSGSEIYVVDDAQCEPDAEECDNGSGGGTGGGGSAGSHGTGDSALPPGFGTDRDEAACACTSTPPRLGALILVLFTSLLPSVRRGRP